MQGVKEGGGEAEADLPLLGGGGSAGGPTAAVAAP